MPYFGHHWKIRNDISIPSYSQPYIAIGLVRLNNNQTFLNPYKTPEKLLKQLEQEVELSVLFQTYDALKHVIEQRHK